MSWMTIIVNPLHYDVSIYDRAPVRQIPIVNFYLQNVWI